VLLHSEIFWLFESIAQEEPEAVGISTENIDVCDRRLKYDEGLSLKEDAICEHRNRAAGVRKNKADFAETRKKAGK
jgi:hypothetical protein